MNISEVDSWTKATVAEACQAYVPGHMCLCFYFLEKKKTAYLLKNVACFVQLGENVFGSYADAERKFLDVLKTDGFSEWMTNVQRSYESLYVVCIVVL